MHACTHTHFHGVSVQTSSDAPKGMDTIRGKIHTDMLCQNSEGRKSVHTHAHTKTHTTHTLSKSKASRKPGFHQSGSATKCTNSKNKYCVLCSHGCFFFVFFTFVIPVSDANTQPLSHTHIQTACLSSSLMKEKWIQALSRPQPPWITLLIHSDSASNDVTPDTGYTRQTSLCVLCVRMCVSVSGKRERTNFKKKSKVWSESEKKKFWSGRVFCGSSFFHEARSEASAGGDDR